MTWLFTAYSIIWIAIFGYIFGLHRKQKELAGDIEALKAKLSP
jgi:CcmD family protein